jgi:hypothetical protein
MTDETTIEETTIEETIQPQPLSEEQQQFITYKIQQIHNNIAEIGNLAPDVADILAHGFVLSMNLLEAIAIKGPQEVNDVNKQIELVTAVLGFDLEKLVLGVVEKANSNGTGNMIDTSKEADEETLKFITSDMDDYERFLAEAKAKDSLDYLKSSI